MSLGGTLNNPGNLLFGTPWQGVIGSQTANGLNYAQFATPEAGVAGLQTDLKTAISRGFNTVSALVYHYLGTSSDNVANPHVASYLAAVSQGSGLSPNSPVTAADVPALARGISTAEGTLSDFPQLKQVSGGLSGAGSAISNWFGNVQLGAVGVEAIVTNSPYSIGGHVVTPQAAGTAAASVAGVDLSGVTKALDTFNGTLSKVFSADTWQRVAFVGLAVVLLVGALIMLAKPQTIQLSAA